VPAPISTLGEELRAQLLADQNVTGLIVDRILPDVAPGQIVLPCVVFDHLGSSEQYHLDGLPYVETARLVYSCMGKTWTEARRTLDAIRWKAINTRGFFNGVMIEQVSVADIRDKGYNNLTRAYEIDLELEIIRTLL
jgi:hypothetical protein